MKLGILESHGEFVICDEIDLCDTEFHQRAIARLETGAVDMVIGSKLIAGAEDDRPWARHAASLVYTNLLRITLGFRGTDTHGLKAFRRSALIDIAADCLVDRDVFASEFVIRAYRAKVPIDEKRPPSINLLKRVPNVLKNLVKLSWAIRLGTEPPSRRNWRSSPPSGGS